MLRFLSPHKTGKSVYEQWKRDRHRQRWAFSFAEAYIIVKLWYHLLEASTSGILNHYMSLNGVVFDVCDVPNLGCWRPIVLDINGDAVWLLLLLFCVPCSSNSYVHSHGLEPFWRILREATQRARSCRKAWCFEPQNYWMPSPLAFEYPMNWFLSLYSS